MSEEYPLYPKLTEAGEEEAQQIMDNFKPRILSLVDELLGDLYADVSMHIESDHWANYRIQLMDGLKGYRKGRKVHEYDFAELRKTIYENNKDEIINDLNADLVKENERLKRELENAYSQLRQVRY